MDRDDIIKMAKQAKLPYEYDTGRLLHLKELERFAALVAAAEREACAELCEEHIGEDRYDMFGKDLAKQCAEAIRERGEQ